MVRWLKEALKFSGLSQSALAGHLTKKLGRSIDRAAVNKMTKNSRDIKADEAFAISEITGYPMPDIGAAITSVPLLEWVAAGQLTDPRSQIPVEDVPLLAFADLGRGEFFALKVKGDSMDRISPEDSTIIVNRADRTLVKGKPFVFSTRDGTTYKLWQPGDPAYLESFSTNPMHKPIFVRKRRDMEVVGRQREADAHGASLSGSLGYNIQFGNLVTGLELSGRYGRESFSDTGPLRSANFGETSLTGTATPSSGFNVDASIHAAIRAGLAFGDTLAFVKAGAGIAHASEFTRSDVNGTRCDLSGFAGNTLVCVQRSQLPSPVSSNQAWVPSVLFGLGIEHNFGPIFGRVEVEAEGISRFNQNAIINSAVAFYATRLLTM
jgi:SOS-response transcriptional repressor LexA